MIRHGGSLNRLTNLSNISIRSGFSPLSLSPLLWFDLSDLTTTFQDSLFATPAVADNDPIGGLKDKSGNASHLTQAGTARPLLKLAIQNGKPVARFDGINDSLRSAATFNLKPVHLFAVVKVTSFAAVRTFFGPTNGGGLQYRSETTGKQGLVKSQITNIAASTSSLSAATVANVNVSYDGSGNWAFRTNGSADGSGLNNQSFSTTAVALGENVGSEWMFGDIAELIAFSSVQSAGNIVSLEGYLKAKWGTP